MEEGWQYATSAGYRSGVLPGWHRSFQSGQRSVWSRCRRYGADSDARSAGESIPGIRLPGPLGRRRVSGRCPSHQPDQGGTACRTYSAHHFRHALCAWWRTVSIQNMLGRLHLLSIPAGASRVHVLATDRRNRGSRPVHRQAQWTRCLGRVARHRKHRYRGRPRTTDRERSEDFGERWIAAVKQHSLALPPTRFPCAGMQWTALSLCVARGCQRPTQ